MAYTRPQAAPTVVNGSGLSIAKAYTNNVTAHSLLVAFATTDLGDTHHTYSSPGAVWANITPVRGDFSNQWISIGYCLDAPAGATTVTCTFSTSGNFNALIIGEYAAPGGIASLLDTNTPGQNLGISSTPTDSSMAAAVGDLVVSWLILNGAATITAGGGFTIAQQDATDNGAAEYQLSAAGSVAPSFTLSVGQLSVIMSAAFKTTAVAITGPTATIVLQAPTGTVDAGAGNEGEVQLSLVGHVRRVGGG